MPSRLHHSTPGLDSQYEAIDLPSLIERIRASNNPAAALADRWLLLSAYGPRARLLMTMAWVALAGLVCVNAVWLSFSRLSFATSN
jgi:hypothetical protein